MLLGYRLRRLSSRVGAPMMALVPVRAAMLEETAR